MPEDRQCVFDLVFESQVCQDTVSVVVFDSPLMEHTIVVTSKTNVENDWGKEIVLSVWRVRHLAEQ